MKEYERVALTKDRLREAMRMAGKKQADLVRETGLNRGTVSRYLSGEVEPRHEATHKLAKALDVSEMWLFGYDVPMQRPAEQKKNDQLVELIAMLRRDPGLFDFVVSVSKLSAEDRTSVERIVASLSNK
jgi:transcriptional regulator with XRE-family HTH domain